jgi:hypothetical protein
MVLQGSAILNVMVNSLGAMAKVAIVSAIGYACALFPRHDPFFSTVGLRIVSRLSNFVFLPALIIASLGATLSVDLLGRMGILVMFSFFTSVVSYMLGSTLGKFILNFNIPSEEEALDVHMNIPIYVSIGSPNIVSLPLMVLQTLCESQLVNAEYGGDRMLCFQDAGSMLFVFSIAWHLVFWGYGYQMLKGLKESADHKGFDQVNSDIMSPKSAPSLSSLSTGWTEASSLIQRAQVVLKDWITNVMFSPLLLSIYLGVTVGLVEPLRVSLFSGNMTALRPLGATSRSPLVSHLL